MARRMAGVGLVTVSLRRSIMKRLYRLCLAERAGDREGLRARHADGITCAAGNDTARDHPPAAGPPRRHHTATLFAFACTSPLRYLPAP